MSERGDTMRGTLSLKSGFANNHLRVAVHHAREAYRVEQANKVTEFGGWFDEMMMSVPVSIVMSAAALEANANEIIGDILGAVRKAVGIRYDVSRVT